MREADPIGPVEPLARGLAAYPEHMRATPEQAIALLHAEGRYRKADIVAGIDRAMALVRSGVAAAASDHPIARAVALARDLAALLVVLVGAADGGSVLP